LLARIGGYALRYQPAARPSRHRPQAEHWIQANVDAPAADESRLLRDLLDQRIVWVDEESDRAESHEAVTIEMQALRGVVVGE